MAYFANGSEGMKFDEQCSKCICDDSACPIAWIQLEYNYEQCGNELASKILNELVSNNGECSMGRMFSKILERKN